MSFKVQSEKGWNTNGWKKKKIHRVISRLYEVDFGSSSDSVDNIKAQFALTIINFYSSSVKHQSCCYGYLLVCLMCLDMQFYNLQANGIQVFSVSMV